MTKTAEANPIKTRRQLARAHKLVAVLETQPECCCDVTCLTVARNLAPNGWVQLAGVAGITPPSPTTIAMAIGILEAWVAGDAAAGRELAAQTGMDRPEQDGPRHRSGDHTTCAPENCVNARAAARRATDSQGYRRTVRQLDPETARAFACFAGSDQR